MYVRHFVRHFEGAGAEHDVIALRNLRIFIKMVDLRESLHISFDYRVSRPKSLATRMLHALLQILEN